MILVIGGAYMGKLSWVKKEYRIADADICDLAEGYEPGKKCFRHLESLTKRLAAEICSGAAADGETETGRFAAANPDANPEKYAAERSTEMRGCDMRNRDTWASEGTAVLPDFPADAIIISREIGSGVVPVDAADRRWRDVHGSLLQKLSAECSSVYRVYFGIAEKLK